MPSDRLMAREIFVVSDLHIGGHFGSSPGDRGFRINSKIDNLAGFIDEIRERHLRTGRRTDLVINGDFVDFLAEEIPKPRQGIAFIDDDESALGAVDSIINRDIVVFEALRKAVSSGVYITILLGNHDIELSVPAVRQRLFEAVCAHNSNHCRFIYDGEALVIGDVLIEHGNRYDGFNVVDHDRLRRFRSARSRQLVIREDAKFYPPPGSQLVEQIMNPIKEDYPFIDLLKPETEAVIPLLLALEPTLAKDVERIWRLYNLNNQANARAPSKEGWPARAGDISARSKPSTQSGEIRELLSSQMGVNQLDRLIALTELADQESKSLAQNIGIRNYARRALSLLKLVTTDSNEKRMKVLLDALQCLQKDSSFDRSIESDAYLTHAKALLSTGFRVVVFGHTHLAKDIQFENGTKYLNTGTWADLMQVPSSVFSSDSEQASVALEDFVATLKKKDIEAYVKYIPTYAQIELDKNGQTISAQIKDYVAGGVAVH